MADAPPRNHGNNVEVNNGTINQYLGQPPRPKRKPRWKLPKLGQVTVLGRVAILGVSLVSAALGTRSYTHAAHPAGRKAYYCASGNTVKYHASPTCRGLSSCTAQVATSTLAQVRRQQMEPCLVCHR